MFSVCKTRTSRPNIRNGGALPPSHRLHTTRWPQLSDISIFPCPGFELQLPKYERNLKPEIFAYFSGQERGGVGIQLPSIPLWPWSSSQERKARPVSSLNIGQRRQETGDPRYHSVSHRTTVIKSTRSLSSTVTQIVTMNGSM